MCNVCCAAVVSTGTHRARARLRGDLSPCAILRPCDTVEQRVYLLSRKLVRIKGRQRFRGPKRFPEALFTVICEGNVFKQASETFSRYLLVWVTLAAACLLGHGMAP